MDATKRKFVFVIGAGASADFGFPVGQTIATEIISRLDLEFREGVMQGDPGPISSALGSLALKQEYRLAARELRAGIGPGETIDQFLFRRSDNSYVRDLGLMTLAHVILDAERKSQLMQFDVNNYEASLNALRTTNNSWPAALLDLLIGIRSPRQITPDVFKDIAFLIFNYDRCIEQTLFHHLHRRHNLPTAVALDIVMSIPMVHVYGVLGDFDGSIPFGAPSAPLAEISKVIRTYHEGVADETHAAKIHSLIDDAEKIIFLGFGFHIANLRLLFKEGLPTARLMGTMLNCPRVEPLSTLLKAAGSAFYELNCTAFIRDKGWPLMHAPWDPMNPTDDV